jgi:hypothetical protein
MVKSFINILNGAASIFDLCPPPISERVDMKFMQQSEEDMMREDWETVGNDLREAMSIVGEGRSGESKT